MLLAALSLAVTLSVQRAVSAAVEPLMKADAIPGMAVGVVVDGKPYVFNYGVASRGSGAPVTETTLFELGSVSKTFTATLASYEATTGRLSLTAPVRTYLPELRRSAFGTVSLLNLATHTPGGIPLQVPDDIHDDAALMRYLYDWRPRYAAGTYRTYSNVGIGVLGLIDARAMGQPFDVLMERDVFAPLGMRHTYIRIPAKAMASYAQGYRDGRAVRMTPGELWEEAYGVRTTASDMVRYIQANMDQLPLDRALAVAIARTHTGYFRDGLMTQDLIWEQLSYPASLNALLAANSAAMLFDATPVTAIVPPQAPRERVWINKTGSTNGFAAYVAFIPSERSGIVLLANKSFPIPERVALAHTILTALFAENQ